MSPTSNGIDIVQSLGERDAAGGPTFPFMSLFPEIRRLIYHEILARRTIILRDHLTPTYFCGRRYRQYHIADSTDAEDDGIVFLLVCKQIYAEARPLLERRPFHLVLSRELSDTPRDIVKLEKELGVPLKHITHVSLNAKTLGKTTKIPPQCPRRLEVEGYQCFLNCDFGRDHCFTPDGPPAEPERIANLEGIHHLSSLLVDCIPGLHELHIYDVLKAGKSWDNLCKCASKSCICGNCTCTCQSHPLVPREKDITLDETKAQLHQTFQSRFQAALPEPSTRSPSRTTTFHCCYSTILALLARGVHIFLHDELTLRVPANDSRSMCKGTWRATYHIIPPLEATTPPSIPAESAETPRTCRLRHEEEERVTRERREQMTIQERVTAGVAEIHAQSSELFWSTMGREKILCSEEFPLKLLAEYDAVLDVRIVDAGTFDVVTEEAIAECSDVSSNGEDVKSVEPAPPARLEAQCEKLWRWS